MLFNKQFAYAAMALLFCLLATRITGASQPQPTGTSPIAQTAHLQSTDASCAQVVYCQRPFTDSLGPVYSLHLLHNIQFCEGVYVLQMACETSNQRFVAMRGQTTSKMGIPLSVQPDQLEIGEVLQLVLYDDRYVEINGRKFYLIKGLLLAEGYYRCRLPEFPLDCSRTHLGK